MLIFVMSSANTILSLQKVSKSFGKQEVLKEISLDIPKGTIFGVVGSSGSGKSTLLNIITGNILPDKGDVLFEPKDLARYNLLDPTAHLQSVNKDILALKSTVGYSPQVPSFYEKLTCKENIDFFGSLYRLPKEVLKINSNILLKLVGLEEWSDKLAEELSGGMQKRLDLACSLIHDPKILVLDEPTADLDFILREQMWNLIRKIKQKGTTIIMSSHFIDEIEGLCDKIIILNNSKIEFVGSPEALKKRKEASLVIKIQTSEKNYPEIEAKLLKNYSSVLETNFRDTSGFYIIKLKGVKDNEKEVCKVLALIKQTKQNISNFSYSKEGISEMFELINSNVPEKINNTKKSIFHWFKKKTIVEKTVVDNISESVEKEDDEKDVMKNLDNSKKTKHKKGEKDESN